MPWAPKRHRPPGWAPAQRVRTDSIDRSYGTQQWRRLAKSIIERDRGICALCGQQTAVIADHIIEKRFGGMDHPSNLRALCRPCHGRRHASGHG